MCKANIKYNMNSKGVTIILSIIIILITCHSASGVKKQNNNLLLIGYGDPNQTVIIEEGDEYLQSANIGIAGNGTLIIKGKFELTGQIKISGDGKLIVEGGEFHISGNDTNIYIGENGSVVFKNQALLHYIQSYIGQHNIIMWDNGKFELSDTEVDADKSIEFIWMVGNSSYIAERVKYKQWKTWFLWNNTNLSVKDINYGGDIVFYDSPTIYFENANIIMPWCHFGRDAVVDYTFPEPDNEHDPMNVVITKNTLGFSGIPWKMTIKNSRYILWGINPYPGSNVTVKNSSLKMIMFRFLNKGKFNLNGIMKNDSTYKDITIPVKDRNLRLINTSVKWWKVDVCDNFELNADGIVFSEMANKDNSRTILTNSICEGQTVNLGVEDNAYIHFSDGEVWSFVSAWENSTIVLENSLIDWRKGKYIYQRTNIAHGNSRMYCLNCDMAELPKAYDNALVLFAYLNSIDSISVGQKVNLNGSAWISPGPKSNAKFAQYILSYRPDNSEIWTDISTEKMEVYNDTLGLWDTVELKPGKYQLRLNIKVNVYSGRYNPNNYYAVREVILNK